MQLSCVTMAEGNEAEEWQDDQCICTIYNSDAFTCRHNTASDALHAVAAVVAILTLPHQQRGASYAVGRRHGVTVVRQQAR